MATSRAVQRVNGKLLLVDDYGLNAPGTDTRPVPDGELEE